VRSTSAAAKFAVVLAALICSWTLPSVAQASEFYYHGTATTNADWPYCGSGSCFGVVSQYAFHISESSARTINGNTVCAFSYDNPSLAPTAVVCSSSLAVKPLCGCTSRFGASRSTVGGAVPRGRAQVVY
jgi:hypothetical protein